MTKRQLLKLKKQNEKIYYLQFEKKIADEIDLKNFEINLTKNDDEQDCLIVFDTEIGLNTLLRLNKLFSKKDLDKKNIILKIEEVEE